MKKNICTNEENICTNEENICTNEEKYLFKWIKIFV
jgi:hypothetical protein